MPSDQVSDIPAEPREAAEESVVGMRFVEIKATVEELSSERSSSVEEALDTGLWPDDEMPEAQVRGFVAALRRQLADAA